MAYDYSWPGYYFITICTKDRRCFLGNIINGQMVLSEIGIIVRSFWIEIPERYPVARLDEWNIMPNHVHGILVIEWDNASLRHRGCVCWIKIRFHQWLTILKEIPKGIAIKMVWNISNGNRVFMTISSGMNDLWK